MDSVCFFRLISRSSQLRPFFPRPEGNLHHRPAVCTELPLQNKECIKLHHLHAICMCVLMPGLNRLERLRKALILAALEVSVYPLHHVTMSFPVTAPLQCLVRQQGGLAPWHRDGFRGPTANA